MRTIRNHAPALVAACASLGLTACGGAPPASPPPLVATAAVAPVGPAASVPTGGPHDFDFLEGAWTTAQHRLKARGVGSHNWDEFTAKSCVTLHLGGMADTDEMVPTRGWAGVTLRTFDVQKKTWFIYWVSSRTGVLQPPVAGGFTGNRGEFYGDDDDDGRPIRARFVWTSIDPDHARWEQAFSYDGGHEWETNWTADFTRADEAKACDHGRPR